MEKSPECNEGYFAKTGYGFGRVLSGSKHVEALRSLSVKQIEALLEIILLGDINEIGGDELILGDWKMTKEDMSDGEGETRKSLAASLVYLSGHLAEDFLFLVEKEKK